MITALKPLLALTAEDLMSPDPVTIPKEMSLQAAARLLSQHHVSGAPVVNSEGVCIGMLSATDFVHWAEHGHGTGKADAASEYCQAWHIADSDILPADSVANFMTADPVTIPPTKSISEVARQMIDAHIHRVVVVDEQRRPLGIVSSTDILAAVAYSDPRSRLSEF